MRKPSFLETTSVFACIFTSISICLGSDVFLAKPKNVAVTAGQRMEMECRAGYESKVTAWYFQSIASRRSPVTLVANIESKSQFSVNVSREFGVNFDANGSGMIYINSTSTQDAGSYICEVESNSNTVKFNAQLIVFESEPICETDLRERSKLFTDENKITMRCNVSYRGDWLPTVEWRQHNSIGGWGDYVRGTPVANGHGLVETSFVNSVSVSSSLTVAYNSTIDGSFFSFNVFFTSLNDSIRTNAANIPDFRLTWNSTTISTDSTPSTETTAKSGSTNHGHTSSDHRYLMVIVIVGVLFFVLSLLIAIVCWNIVRKKTAEWMADFVSSYENVDSRSRVARYSTIDRRRCCSIMGDMTMRENNRPTSGGYTEANFTQVYSEANYSEEGASKFPKYSQVMKKNSGESTENVLPAASASNSDRNENDELYATLRKDIEPSKVYSMYASGNDDFNDDESQDSTTITRV